MLTLKKRTPNNKNNKNPHTSFEFLVMVAQEASKTSKAVAVALGCPLEMKVPIDGDSILF